MRRVGVFSGKGGTGKTTLTALLSRELGPLVTVDCDVDAANLALFIPGQDSEPVVFHSGSVAAISTEACLGCGSCLRVCRFDAIIENGPWYQIDPMMCEGCGACGYACPTEAVSFSEQRVGTWAVRQTDQGPLVWAELDVGQDSSGKLVAELRQRGDELAKGQALSMVLVDGPPGIGCPVHAALGGLDLVVAVTEPSVSGLSDLRRLVGTARHFKISVCVLVNRWDLSPEYAQAITDYCQEQDLPVVGKIPFDRSLSESLSHGVLPSLDHCHPETGATVRRLVHQLKEGLR